MPRKPREISETGYYHVTQRGNAHGIIFETDEIRWEFLEILDGCRRELGFRIVCWCLMDDHFHLVLEIPNANLSQVMHAIETRFSKRVAKMTGREGHLFSGRFYSGCITTQAQLAATISYVHLNPEAARICAARDYLWSSLHECLTTPFLVDTEWLLKVMGCRDANELADLKYRESDVVYAGESRTTLTDSQAATLAKELLDADSLTTLVGSDRAQRNALIKRLYTCGARVPQIARLAELSTSTVYGILATAS